MARIVTLGEIMLRLKAPGHERLLQSPVLEATFGGSEANVAVSLAGFGHEAVFVTALPDNDLGAAALTELRRFGVGLAHVVHGGERIGIYFLETGSNQRPSKALYDRANTALAAADPSAFDWAAVFAGADWFHITGITPALSERAAELSLEACRQAKRRGVRLSCDLNYRHQLWNYGKTAPEIMCELFALVDLGIGGKDDFRLALGINAETAPPGEIDVARYETLTSRVVQAYPNLSALAVTLRASQGADHNGWSACLRHGETFIVGPHYEITDIVDRIGAGDSFAAGLIDGLGRYADPADALAFATAAGCLKHTISGDFNRVSVAEIERLMAGDASGRVQR